MTIPTLTDTQKFQNTINSTVQQINNNLNPQNQEGITGVYTRWYNTLFANAAGTAAVVTQLGVQAAATFAFMTAFYTFLNGVGVTGLSALPAYTVNQDGTVTLS